jgi:hypothetical protein
VGHPLSRIVLSTSLFALGAATFGCGSDKSPRASGIGQEQQPDEVSWNGQIAPIVSKKCTGCHHTGGIAPMSLETYASAKVYAATMLAEVQAGLMPPWGARNTDECTPPFAFKDDPRLTDDELELLQAWVDAGAPEGAASTKPLPKPITNELTDADLHLTIPTTIDVAGTDDRMVCFSLDPQVDEVKWINAAQVTPGNAEIVHHVLVFADPDGQSVDLAGSQGYYDCFGGPQLDKAVLLAAWAPGGVPMVTPPDVALDLSAHSRLVMQVHYHPHTAVKSTVDSSTSVDLRFSPDVPKYPGRLELIGNLGQADMKIAGGRGYGLQPDPDDTDPKNPQFVIPPNKSAHTESMRVLIQPASGVAQYRIWGVATHMHYFGTDMKIDVTHPDGSNDCLLQTPAWDFNWQRVYYYDAPLDSVPSVTPGDVLNLRCSYDNTMDNPFVREALAQQGYESPVSVPLGETTLDEMCLGAFGIAMEGNGVGQ